MIRTAILGYGRNGSTMHANPIEKYTEYFEVAAVCDTDIQAREKAAQRFGCPVYEDYKAMLLEIRPEFTVIITYSCDHAQMAIDCLMAGSHVLVTKPWATNAADAQRMMDAQKASGKKLLPWLPARWGADLKMVKSIIDSGDIGCVFEIRRSVNNFRVRNDWQTKSEYGGGYLLNWGPHLVDQPLQLTSSPVKRVYGNLRQIINPGDVEDNLRVICHLEDGTTVISEHLIAAGEYPSWIIQGDRGTIYVMGETIHVHKAELPDAADIKDYGTEGTKTQYSKQIIGNNYGDEFEVYKHIAHVLRGEEEYFVTLESAWNLSRILDAARQSSVSGQEVFL